MSDAAARMDPHFLTAMPFSRLCRSGRCGECALVRKRCGCFCHPPGFVPIDEGDQVPGPFNHCPDPDCDSVFMDPKMLASHVKREHPELATQPEQVAPSEPRPSELAMAASEPEPEPEPDLPSGPGEVEGKPFVCEGCGKRYAKEGYLKRHMQKEHRPKRGRKPPADTEPAPISASREPEPEPTGGEVGGETGMEEYALVIEVAPGVGVKLIAQGPMAYSMACEAAIRHGVPFIGIQPD